MTQTQYLDLYKSMTTIPNIVDTADNYFSDKHMMTNKELCGQVNGYVREINSLFSPSIPYTLDVAPLPKNGARFVLNYIDEFNERIGIGYTGTVYAIARKNNIIKKIMDIFRAGLQIIDNNTYNDNISFSEVGVL